MFAWSGGWFGLAILYYGIIAICVAIAAGVQLPERKKRFYDYELERDRTVYTPWTSEQKRKATVAGVITFVILAFAVNIGTYFSSDEGKTEQMTSTEATAVFGLESGKSYPLILGDRFGGSKTTVSATWTRGFVVRSRPASALSVEFTNGPDSYILELPVEKLTFRKSSGQPSMVLRLSEQDGYGAFGTVVYTPTDPCDFKIQSGLASCHHVLSSKANLSEAQRRLGLSPIVGDTLVSGVITLTPAMFDEVLGRSS